MAETIDIPIQTKKDFVSDQLVRWCPGCGDYSILSAMQQALPRLGKKKEDFVFISGIGCAARFPYYMNTYGFHTIHGRGPAVATGTKLSNPDLSVWEIQGDGDALAIGTSHFIHAIRRNIDINIMLFNNEIYGLTKGQSSPTSRPGLITKSTPFGVVDRPFKAGELAIGSQGSFFARTIDTSPKLMADIFVAAEQHRGTSLVEILQNCVIFNDKTHKAVTAKENKANYQLHLEDGQPMLFGDEKSKGLVLDGLKLKVATIGENGVTANDILVHDSKEEDVTLHLLLLKMAPPLFPMALGIIRAVEGTTYDDTIHSQIEHAKQNTTIHSMDDLLNSGNNWTVD